MERTEIDVREYTEYRELYSWILIPTIVVVFVVMEKTVSQDVDLMAFHTPWVLFLALIFIDYGLIKNPKEKRFSYQVNPKSR